MGTTKKDLILELLKKRKTRTQKRLSRLKQQVNGGPQDSLRVVTKHNKVRPPLYQYYLITKKNDTQGKYLKREQTPLAAAIAQKDYEKALLAEQRRELQFLESTITRYIPEEPEAVYEGLHPGRKLLVKPTVITDSQYISQWLNKTFDPNSFPKKPQMKTASGTLVRSKSEMIIADCLYEAGIPFIYEYPFKFGMNTYYADFYCLNPQTREEFVWEHFGRMDDPSYCKHTIAKIRDYTLGLPHICRLLPTFEDGETSFTRQLAEAALKTILTYTEW